MDYLLWLTFIGAALFITGVVLLAVARRTDAKNYILQKATPMPLSLVNVRDDVWLRGTGTAPAPLVAPHFGIPCITFSYELEERVTETYRENGKTKTRRVWKTRDRRSGDTDFVLDDGKGTIRIDGQAATFKHLPSQQERIGDWRHTLSYLASPSTISAVGTISEGKTDLEAYRNIPLLVTTKGRDDFFKGAERAETLMRGFGFTSIFIGAGLPAYALFDHIAWPAETGGSFHPGTCAMAALAAFVVYLPIWTMYLYNTFVTHRVRTRNAWRQIDVDLKMRYDLIPNLVNAVKGFMAHEGETLESIVRLRNEAVSGGHTSQIAVEGQLADQVTQFMVLVENYPDMKAQPLTAKLMRELTAIEEKIAHGRKTYNEVVLEYNDNVMKFPRGLLAKLFGFKQVPWFATEDRSAVKVDFKS